MDNYLLSLNLLAADLDKQIAIIGIFQALEELHKIYTKLNPKKKDNARSRKRKLRKVAKKKQGFVCFYCCESLAHIAGTADHLIPRSNGGLTSIYNIVAACDRCNSVKGNIPVIQFFEQIQGCSDTCACSSRFFEIKESRKKYLKILDNH